MKSEDEDDVVSIDESFFVNDDYRLTTFTFGSEVLQLLCLNSASTDFDLTGQLVWPGAVLLNEYLSKNADMLHGHSIIELGSGVVSDIPYNCELLVREKWSFHSKRCLVDEILSQYILWSYHITGVTGILCSRFCHEIVLTDHNEEVLKILRKNIELHESSSENSTCAGLTAKKLEWGNSDHLDHILQGHVGGFDLVIGADICFQQSSIPLLFNTVEKLLRVRGKGQCKFILAYISRVKIMDIMVTSEATEHGLQIHEIAGTRSVVGNLEGVIYEITL